MRIAVYGGSFDPPHVGHAMVAGWLLWTGRVDEVWLVPAFQHAFSKPLSSFERRVALCAALARDVDPRVRVDPVEASLPVPSFTLDTLTHLARLHPEHAFHLVVGADVLAQRDHWRRWDLIERDFPPIIVGRQGHAPIPDAPTFPDVSSSEVRARIAAGRSVRHLLTAGVAGLLGVD